MLNWACCIRYGERSYWIGRVEAEESFGLRTL